MNQKGSFTEQDEQNQEQKGCKMNGNVRIRGLDESEGEFHREG
jgi:hypothetical protein